MCNCIYSNYVQCDVILEVSSPDTHCPFCVHGGDISDDIQFIPFKGFMHKIPCVNTTEIPF